MGFRILAYLTSLVSSVVCRDESFGISMRTAGFNRFEK